MAPAAVRKRLQDANAMVVGPVAVRPRDLYQGRPRSITSSGTRPSSPRALLRVQSITQQLPTLPRWDQCSGAGHRLCLQCLCSPLILGSALFFVHTVRQRSVRRMLTLSCTGKGSSEGDGDRHLSEVTPCCHTCRHCHIHPFWGSQGAPRAALT